MNLQRVSLLFISAIVLERGSHLHAQQTPAPTFGASVGFQSSDYDHLIYGLHITIPFTTRWEFTPWLRGSTNDQQQWRASVAVRRLFGPGSARAYVGAGISWTSEVSEVRAHGHWGAVALGGAELPLLLLSPQAAHVRLFTEVQVFTRHYATVQELVGARVRLRHR